MNTGGILSEITADHASDIAKKYFSQKDYFNAIKFFEIAISKNSEISTNHSNLAICYFLIHDYKKTVEHCIKALSLDSENRKALIYYCRSLGNLGKFESNLESIDMALSLIIHAAELCKSNEFMSFQKIINEIYHKLKILRIYKQEEILVGKIEKLKYYYNRLGNSTINELMNKYLKYPNRREIPESLICPITLDLFKNPVITDSGHTYERDYLFEYLKKSGNRDPITKREFVNPKLYANLNVLNATQLFREGHPWSDYENPKSIDEIFFN